MAIYKGEHDGQTIQRKTERHYTHAIAYMGEDGNLYAVSFCGRSDLAKKELAKHQTNRQLLSWKGKNGKLVKLVSGPILVPVFKVEKK